MAIVLKRAIDYDSEPMKLNILILKYKNKEASEIKSIDNGLIKSDTVMVSTEWCKEQVRGYIWMWAELSMERDAYVPFSGFEMHEDLFLV